MKLYADVTREIDEMPEGPEIVAFFDLDGTLLSGFSVTSMMRERLTSGELKPRQALVQFVSFVGQGFRSREFPAMLKAATRTLEGVEEASFVRLGRETFRKYVSGAIYPESRALVRAHQRKGHTVVVLSSATPYQVTPVAEELDIEHVLCTRFEVEEGRFTGRLVEPITYGEGKLVAARKFLKARRLKLANSFFYTDGAEDVPLLEHVGYPRPLNPDGDLEEVAGERGWPIRRFHSRGLPGVRELLGTGLAWGALVSSALASVPVLALNRSRRDAANLAIATFGDFASALAGLDLQVTGEQHLWSHRPAVFVFNHQSGADMVILAKLLRQDFTGIAKKELRSNPILGPLMWATETVFIDRANTERAIEAMRPAVETLKSGLSIVLAPEGTRSLSDRLGPFKKGAFHLAMQAGVPMVPIVIHNATDALPKSGIFVRPAIIKVEILPPVPTDDWEPETIDRHVRGVRRMFLKALDQLPEPGEEEISNNNKI
ncbi:MAG TPA: HAD-IB family hydrolase [Woeseiaceae bacterium]|nr:HAD-IB family hydrolase [Woeseiaceae bacterium]